MSIYNFVTAKSPQVRNPDKPQSKAIAVPRTEEEYAQLMLATIKEKPALVNYSRKQTAEKYRQRAAGKGKTSKQMRLSEARRNAILDAMEKGKKYKARDLEVIISQSHPQAKINTRSLASNLSILNRFGEVEKAGDFRDADGSLYILWRKL